MPDTKRRGFTLIELLTVTSILGILALLLMAAVMRGRESARRAECLNKLRQLGVALQSHSSVHGAYPVPMPARFRAPSGRYVSSYDSISGYYELLPYLEETAVYNSINVGDRSVEPDLEYPATYPTNSTAFTTRVSHFLCPSDAGVDALPGGPNSYRFNVGYADPTTAFLDTTRAGAFEVNRPGRSEDFRDGLAYTAGIGERLVGGGESASHFNRERDFWFANVLPLIDSRDDDATLNVCRQLSGYPPGFTTVLGASWMIGGSYGVWYNHVAPPNIQGPDCTTGDGNTADPMYCQTCSIATRSLHGGGVNSLRMDGSVHFQRDTINLRTWRALGTRSGSEVIDSDL